MKILLSPPLVANVLIGSQFFRASCKVLHIIIMYLCICYIITLCQLVTFVLFFNVLEDSRISILRTGKLVKSYFDQFLKRS